MFKQNAFELFRTSFHRCFMLCLWYWMGEERLLYDTNHEFRPVWFIILLGNMDLVLATRFLSSARVPTKRLRWDKSEIKFEKPNCNRPNKFNCYWEKQFRYISLFALYHFTGLLVNGCINVVITTIEKRFGLRSAQTGLVASGYDISSFVCLVPVTYFGGRATASKPKWIGIGMILMGLGSLVFALPHFIVGTYRATSVEANVCLTEGAANIVSVNSRSLFIIFSCFCLFVHILLLWTSDWKCTSSDVNKITWSKQ